jgi:periplasmic divalent cation tolerance protein
MNQTIFVLTNLPDASTAKALARMLVERQLAACVNCLPGVRSIYRWKGVVEEAEEVTILIKSTQKCYSALEEAIKNAHPYETPEIVAAPIMGGWPPYLAWIAEQVKSGEIDV